MKLSESLYLVAQSTLYHHACWYHVCACDDVTCHVTVMQLLMLRHLLWVSDTRGWRGRAAAIDWCMTWRSGEQIHRLRRDSLRRSNTPRSEKNVVHFILARFSKFLHFHRQIPKEILCAVVTEASASPELRRCVWKKTTPSSFHQYFVKY